MPETNIIKLKPGKYGSNSSLFYDSLSFFFVKTIDANSYSVVKTEKAQKRCVMTKIRLR